MPATKKRASAFRFIIAIGVVSLFADMTYEGARSVVGPFLKDLGASATQVGIIAEGEPMKVLTADRIREVFGVEPTFVPADHSGIHLIFD